jgi:hypothetical protein
MVPLMVGTGSGREPRGQTAAPLAERQHELLPLHAWSWSLCWLGSLYHVWHDGTARAHSSFPSSQGLLLLIARPNAARGIAMVASHTCFHHRAGPVAGGMPGRIDFPRHHGLGARLGIAPHLGLRRHRSVDVDAHRLLIFPFIIGAGAKARGEPRGGERPAALHPERALRCVHRAERLPLLHLLRAEPGAAVLPAAAGVGRTAGRSPCASSSTRCWADWPCCSASPTCVVQEPSHSADFSALHALQLPYDVQIWLFWALFLAFAVKLPIFPFHSWQPDTYTMAPLQGTMVLGGVLLKMGLFGMLRARVPDRAEGADHWRAW